MILVLWWGGGARVAHVPLPFLLARPVGLISGRARIFNCCATS